MKIQLTVYVKAVSFASNALMISSTVETLEREAASAVVVKAVSGAQDKSGAQKLANARPLFMMALICVLFMPLHVSMAKNQNTKYLVLE